LVIGLWVALAAVMVPLSGKLSSVTTVQLATLPATGTGMTSPSGASRVVAPAGTFLGLSAPADSPRCTAAAGATR
jgi:hypothetical protein